MDEEKKGYIAGLDYAIDSFAPAVKEFSMELARQQSAGSSTVVQAHIRGGLRAFCDMVGALKIERHTAATGNEPNHLTQRRQAFRQASAAADVVENNLTKSRSPEEASKLAHQWEVLERKADFHGIAFAIGDDPDVAEISKMMTYTKYRH